MSMRQKVLYLAFFFLAVWLLFPGMETRAAEGKARVLEVTRGEYGSAAENLSPGPQNDGENFARVIREAYGENFAGIVKKDREGVTTIEGVKQLIQDTFAQSADKDVNYFYYSGHGTRGGLYLGGSQIMSAADLADAFAGIKGTNILVADCCYSGGLAARSSRQAESAAGFADEFVDAFEEAVEASGTDGIQSRSALTNSRFKLLMAASEEELSWQMDFPEENGEDSSTISLGGFTMTVCYGCGIDPRQVKKTGRQDYRLPVISADYDLNGEVSLSEITDYVENTYYYSANHVRSYPAGDAGCFLPVSAEQKPQISFQSAYINKEDGAVDVCYSSQKSVPVDYAVYCGNSDNLGTLSYDGIYYDAEFSEYAGLTKVGEVKGYGKIAAGASGDYVVRIPIEGEWPDGKYYILLQTEGQKLRYLVPFALASREDEALKEKFQIKLSGDCYAGKEGEIGIFEPENGEELVIRADFGTGMELEEETPYLSCYVYDAEGRLVCTLGSRELMQAVPEYNDSGSRIKEVHYYRNFYWNGKDAQGNPVPIDTYYIRVLADGAVKAEQSERVIVRRAVEQAEIKYLTVSENQIVLPLSTDAKKPRISFLTNEDGKVTLKLLRKEADGTDSEEMLGTYAAVGGQRLTVIWNGMFGGEEGKPGTYTAAAEFEPSDTAHAKVTKESETFAVTSSEKIPLKEEIPEEGCELVFQEEMETEASKDAEILPVSIALWAEEKNVRKITMGVKEKIQLEAMLTPSNASGDGMIYKSSNPRIVSVSQSGKMKAKKRGKAVITLTAKNGKTVSVAVTVKKAPDQIAFSVKKKTLKKGKAWKLKVKLPAGAASYKITFSSSKKKVVSVKKDGRVKAIKKGNAVITARSYNGKKARIKITVK